MVKLTLYHYSSQDFRGYIKTSFFGSNSFTDYSKRLSNVKRSYFYLEPESREYFFAGARFLYVTEIKASQVYNFNIDHLKLRYTASTSEILRLLIKRGYKGFTDANIVNLFYDVKIKDRLTLTRC